MTKHYQRYFRNTLKCYDTETKETTYLVITEPPKPIGRLQDFYPEKTIIDLLINKQCQRQTKQEQKL